MNKEAILAVLQSFFTQTQPGIAAAYLIGSAAAERMRTDSDIDIALLPIAGTTFSLQERLAMAAALESRLGRTVDMGVITSANLIYASEAMLKGTRIEIADNACVGAMETRLLGCYLQFREDRREVEESYHAA